MLDRVARNAVHPRRGIDLADAVGIGKSARGNLAGSCLFSLGSGGKRKYAACANGQALG